MNSKQNSIKIAGILFMVFATQLGFAQSDKGFYASINSGYAMGTGNVDAYSSMVLGIGNSTQIDASTYQQEYLKINFGKGINAGANLGYMFHKNIGLELGINYLLGGKTTGKSTELSGDYNTAEASAKMIQLKPTLVFRAGFDKINPYAKVGMVIGSGKIINTRSGKDGANVYKETLEFNKGLSIGFQASVGTLYTINPKLSLFGELNLVSLEYAPKKSRYTEFLQNGVDQLSTRTINQKETEFVNSIISTGVTNPNEPSKSPKIPFSFSSIGVNIGVQYHF